MGEVGLPALVGLVGFEPDVGGTGALARLRGDQSRRGQVAGHRRSRHRHAVVVAQVPHDGVRAGVQALLGQLLAQPHDQFDRRGGQRLG